MRTEIENYNDRYVLYLSSFSSLTDLYDYLKSNPEINKNVFCDELSSLDPDTNSYGVPYDEALEYCLSGYNEGLSTFLKTSAKLSDTIKETADNRKLVRGLYGGLPIPPLVASGIPDSMARYELDKTATVRNIYFNVSYPWQTTEDQVINRGLFTLFLVQALEQKGELVNFHLFEASSIDNEVFKTDIILKKPGDLFLDISKCFFPITNIAFLRRICFRILECSPVKDKYWRYSYGRLIDNYTLRKLFNISKDDILITSPESLDIRGDNIYGDTINSIHELCLEDLFDLKKIIDLYNESLDLSADEMARKYLPDNTLPRK